MTGCTDLEAVRIEINARARYVTFVAHSASSWGDISCLRGSVSKRVHAVSSFVHVACRFRALPRAYLKGLQSVCTARRLCCA